MDFKGWIELDDRMYAVSFENEQFVVQKYTKGGNKIHGARKTFTKFEFKEFTEALSIEICELPQTIQELL